MIICYDCRLQCHKVLSIRRSESNVCFDAHLGQGKANPVEQLRKSHRSRLWANGMRKSVLHTKQGRTRRLPGVWLWLFGEHPAKTKGETLACYNPASSACYKPPAVTALSSAAAT